MDTQFKPIPNYEGLYEASQDGVIRTALNKITSNSLYQKRVWKQRVLKYSKRIRHKNGNPDYMVTLWKNNKPHKYLVSRLIAATFCGNYLDTDLTVNHIDGNTLNNIASNLEWVSRADNIKKGFKDGLYDKIKKPVLLVGTLGDKYYFDCLRSADRFLKRYSGYVSNTLKNSSILISKSGERFESKELPF